MRIFAFILALVLTALPLSLAAQSPEEDKGFLVNLLEENLSSAGREVVIDGFRGALSSEASLDRLTISDDEGLWLRLEDVTLDWNRSALLRGRLEVNSLTAARIEVPRLPAPAPPGIEVPQAEAQPFALPELPVSVRIGRIAAGRIELGAPVLGEEAVFSIEGGLSLEDGNGQAQLDLERLDGPAASVLLDASYSNETNVLDLDLQAQEAREGFVVTALDVPGLPAASLILQGQGPLTDFQADIALDTDGTRRLGGQVTLRETVAEGDAAARAFAARLSGDIAPLLAPDYAEFFGGSLALTAEGRRYESGRLELDSFDLRAQQIQMQGSLQLSDAGVPERFALTGRVAGDQRPVLLPLSGPRTQVLSADIEAQFDAAEGDRWQTRALVREFAREGTRVNRVLLEGGGTITARGATRVTADMDFNAAGIDLQDEALAEAVGPAADGNIQLDWTSGGPLEVSSLTLRSGAARLDANARVEGLTGGFPIDGKAALIAPDLSRFAAISGQDLRGKAEANIDGSFTPLSGAFDIVAEVTGEGLGIGIPEVDGVLRGAASVTLDAARDETGTRLDVLSVRTDALAADATGRVDSAAGDLDVDLRLADLAVLERGLDGPLTAAGNVAWTDGDPLQLTRFVIEALDAQIQLQASIDLQDESRPAEGRIAIEADDLARFSSLAGRDLTGRVTAEATGSGALQGRAFDVTISASGQDVTTGVQALDGLLAGGMTLDAAAERQGLRTQITRFELSSDQLQATASGSAGPQDALLRVDARIAELSALQPGLSGPGVAGATIRYDENAPLRLQDAEIRALGATVTADGQVDLRDEALPAQGALQAEIPALSRFSALAGRSLGGSLSLRAEGNAELAGQAIGLSAEGSAQSLSAGLGDLDRLLAGRATFAAKLSGSRISPVIEELRVDAPNGNLRANGQLDGAEGLDVQASIRDIALLAPDFSGPASVRGTVRQQGPFYAVDLNGQGPGGLTAAVSGSIDPIGPVLGISAQGRAPLGLANGFITPRSLQGTANYDLRIDGPPALGSVSGTVRSTGARMSLPTLGKALEDLGATIALNGANARIDLDTSVSGGGRITAGGTLGLNAPFPADIEVQLNQIVLTDPSLYETTVGGRLAITGPTAGGGRVTGRLELGRTEIRVPNGPVSTVGAIPDIEHIAPPPGVQATRQRAGLAGDGRNAGGTSSGSGGPGLALDLTVVAPNQIFVRGRGLDAELGGRLRLTGTTNDIIPIGGFSLIRGRLDILGQRFTLDEGEARLEGSFTPFIRLVAATDTGEVLVQIIVQGPADDPEITFESQPELPQEEVLARLLFNRGLNNISPLQAAQLASAVATLAGRGGDGVIGNLRKETGLDDLDIVSDEEGNVGVRAGKYLSDNVYTDVTVGSTGESEINLNLDVGRNVTVKGRATTEGETGIGVFFEKDY